MGGAKKKPGSYIGIYGHKNVANTGSKTLNVYGNAVSTHYLKI